MKILTGFGSTILSGLQTAGSSVVAVPARVISAISNYFWPQPNANSAALKGRVSDELKGQKQEIGDGAEAVPSNFLARSEEPADLTGMLSTQ